MNTKLIGLVGIVAGIHSAVPALEPVAYKSWNEVLAVPGSLYFGVKADGQAKHAQSFYKPDSPDRDKLTYDLSNNRITAMVTRNGRLVNAGIVTGLERVKIGKQTLRGAPVAKKLVDGGPWGFSIQLNGEEPVKIHEGKDIGSDLLAGFIPVFTARREALQIRWLAFAPVAGSTQVSPRAIIQVVILDNKGATTVKGAVTVDGNAATLGNGELSLAPETREAVLCLDGGKWGDVFPKRIFSLAAGSQLVLAYAFMLGENVNELKATALVLQKQSALNWLGQTLSFHADRLGKLAIPEDGFYAESFVRLAELCRQPAMYMANGEMGGTFIGTGYTGSGMWTKNIWLKDSFYQLLPMSMIDPKLCADSIPFFIGWGMPSRPYGRGLTRFPGAGPETHSLSLALTPFILSGKYYQMTGDKVFFKSHPEILATARQRFGRILDSRKDKSIFLFNSLYVSDGDARGDFHTGSNLLMWYSLEAMARIAREAYGDMDAAKEWSELAQKVRADLQKHCAGDSPDGRRYYEGANQDGTFVEGHDGEESDVGLMPFYGFCEPDDPALILHSRLALTDRNFLYAPGVDGIWWYDGGAGFEGGWNPATFPAWTTALSAAGDEAQLKQRLDKIMRLTDLDGSIWWWPYDYKETSPSAAKRKPVKCGWGAGVYLCHFVNDILGLRVDVPEKKFSFRPFTPWNEFSWNHCRLGNAVFDVAYKNKDGKLSAQIVSRNGAAYAAAIELMLPHGGTGVECRLNGKMTKDYVMTRRYGRPAVRVAATLEPGRLLTLEVLPSLSHIP